MIASRGKIINILACVVLPLAALPLGACGSRTPAGQVVATVNGEEITKRDLAAEFQANNVQPTNEARVRFAMLDRVVRRKLLAQEAIALKMDKSPEYLAAVERARADILAGLLTQRLAKSVSLPSDSEVRKFIEDNPQMFANRQIILVDQVQLPLSGIDPRSLEKYSDLKSITDVFDAQKRKYSRRRTVLDTAAIPNGIASQLATLSPGEVFMVNQGRMLLVNSILKSQPAPVPEERRAAAAKLALERKNSDKAIERQLVDIRKAATISYQKGYAPPAGTAQSMN